MKSVKKRLIIFSILAIALVVCSFFSAYLTPYDPYLQDLTIAKQAPSAEHLLGTDRYGRDMLSRVIAGSRASIFSTVSNGQARGCINAVPLTLMQSRR